jgi:hypothetical protein
MRPVYRFLIVIHYNAMLLFFVYIIDLKEYSFHSMHRCQHSFKKSFKSMSCSRRISYTGKPQVVSRYILSNPWHQPLKSEAGNPYRKGRLSTVGLFELTSSALFIMIILFTFLQKQAVLMRRSTVLSLPLQLVFPGWDDATVKFCAYRPLRAEVMKLQC